MDAWIFIILCVANTYIAILFVISPELAKTVGSSQVLEKLFSQGKDLGIDVKKLSFKCQFCILQIV